jgi:hypothetical protein
MADKNETNKPGFSYGYLIRASWMIVFSFAILFIAAGSIKWVNGWIFAMLTVAYLAVNQVVIYKYNPGLLANRGPIFKKDTKPFDRAIIPLLILLTFLVVDFARAFMVKSIVEQSAREGARILAADESSTYDEVRAKVRALAQASGVTPDTVVLAEDGEARPGGPGGEPDGGDPLPVDKGILEQVGKDRCGCFRKTQGLHDGYAEPDRRAAESSQNGRLADLPL